MHLFSIIHIGLLTLMPLFLTCKEMLILQTMAIPLLLLLSTEATFQVLILLFKYNLNLIYFTKHITLKMFMVFHKQSQTNF
jgi:hypothetical protein